MKQNIIVWLAVVGLVLGGIIGAIINSEQASMFTIAPLGGVIGFLIGWILKARSDRSK